jgi:phosphate transport system protein
MILHREIKQLKQRLLTLGAEVEERLEMALKSVTRRDQQLARQVIEGDVEIDNWEVELEEECLKVLALHQPVAIDLRVLVTVLKINNDLERIGDLASDIAERANSLAMKPEIDFPFDFITMAKQARTMLKKSLDAFIDLDEELASEVCQADDAIDDIHADMFAKIGHGLQERPDKIEELLEYMSISRYLERIGDHATNIAEDVIYLCRGEIVRHSQEVY